jgi:two-component system cell cycle sensor histidine kinase/response regulator CckA
MWQVRNGNNRRPETTPDGSSLEVNGYIRSLVADLPVPAAVVDLDGHAWIWNAASELVFPPPPQTGSAARYPLFSVSGQPWFQEARAEVQADRGRSGLEWVIRGVGGSRYRLGVSVTPLRNGDGAVNAMLVLLQDLTRQDRRVAAALNQARWRRCILNSLPDALVVHRRGAIAYANRRALRLFGVMDPRDVIGHPLNERMVQRVAGSGPVDSGWTHAIISRSDGSTREVEVHRTSVVFRRRNASAITIREVRRRKEARVQSSANQISDGRDGSPRQGVAMLDAVGYVVSWNNGAETLTGYRAEEIVGRDFSNIYTGEGLDSDLPSRALQNAIARGKYEEEGWKRRRDGSRFWCHLTITPQIARDQRIDGFAVVLLDSSEQRGVVYEQPSQDQVREAQRMEAIGRLAGGIAHDFNNLLTAIQGHVQFLLDDLPGDHPSLADAMEIKKSADRATSLTRQLLAFSRRQELQPTIIDLNAIITEMQALLRRVISEDILLQTICEKDIWPVRADAGQLEQVIMNLVVNARDAMPMGGQITIRTANVELDDGAAHDKVELGAGPYVALTVSDSGIGMDEETRVHIFEPFFTTKEPGKGTGLGLATVFGIVKQSGGHIFVQSEPANGSTFKVYLPRVAPTGEVLQRPARTRDSARPGETILVVEDEPAVRALARRVLESRGYNVLEAGTGHEAILAAKTAGKIDLMLSDVVVPDMNGRRIADHILPLRPDLKLLFMSGYTDEDVKQHGILDAASPFLEKPFTPDSLARKVREVLDALD